MSASAATAHAEPVPAATTLTTTKNGASAPAPATAPAPQAAALECDATAHDAHVQSTATSAVDWAVAHGLLIQPPNAHGVPTLVHAPVALLPSPYPLEAYELASALQPLVNLLVDRVSRNSTFLLDALASASEVDPFSHRLHQVLVAALNEPHRQPITLGVHRADYMLHVASPGAPPSLLQVEVNTISAGLVSLSPIASRLHKFVLDSSPLAPAFTAQFPGSRLSVSDSLQGVAEGLGEAWKLYGRADAVVVMVVQPVEFNLFDQRWIEFTLFEKYKVRLVRKTLTELGSEARLVGPEKRLFLGDTEIAVVYFRAGYTPRDYPTENEWTARTTIEVSHAVKCPNIAYHLAGTKKVQQILAMPGVLEKFISSPDQVALLRSTFAGLYPMDSSADGDAALQMALAEPERFVLKPQREGGGNNIYGPQIRDALQTMTPSERNAYILMDHIFAPAFTATVVRASQVMVRQVVSELGMFGVWLSDGDVVHLNKSVGHLLRTKSASVNEGGVANGVAVLDTPLLVPGLVYD